MVTPPTCQVPTAKPKAPSPPRPAKRRSSRETPPMRPTTATTASGCAATTPRPRRRPDLTISFPKRDPSLAVPLPLPPLSATATPASSFPTDHHQDHPSSAPPATLHSAPLLPDLDRVRRLGSGSGGTVHLVRHRLTGRFYALKVIYGHHDDAVRLQIGREIQILRDADSPFVVRCHAMYDHNGEVQILLEHMDGGSLAGRHIPDEPALAGVASQVLQGLAYLHQRKIIHRDIKPSNLLTDGAKRVKIADFGVSRVLAQTTGTCNSSVGTIAYMSPERINTDLNRGAYNGYAGDIWSFGLTMLEFYLGRFPLGESVGKQRDLASLMCAICYQSPPEAPATSSMEFRSFLSCCLQKEPGKRLTAAQLLQHPFITRGQQHHGGGGAGNGGVTQVGFALPHPIAPTALS